VQDYTLDAHCSMKRRVKVVLVVLSDLFRWMGARRNFAETQQSDHAPRSGPVVKNGRSIAKDDMPEMLRCGTIQKKVS